jgi:hypothetical protein
MCFPVCKRIFKPFSAYDVKRRDKNTHERHIHAFSTSIIYLLLLPFFVNACQ